jgi:hypothetical protein
VEVQTLPAERGASRSRDDHQSHIQDVTVVASE